MKYCDFFKRRSELLFDRDKTHAVLLDLTLNDKKTVELLMYAYDIGIVGTVLSGSIYIPSVRDAVCLIMQNYFSVPHTKSAEAIDIWREIICDGIILEMKILNIYPF